MSLARLKDKIWIYKNQWYFYILENKILELLFTIASKITEYVITTMTKDKKTKN